MKQVTLDDRIGDSAPLDELWRELSRLSRHIHDDNQKYPDRSYPIEVRRRQLVSIQALVTAINEHH